MKLVIRVGGSVVGSPINPELMNQYVNLLSGLKTRGHKVAVVVGGGSLSRELIGVARAMGLSERYQDKVAISVSRVLAQLFAFRLGRLCGSNVPTSIDRAAKLFGSGRIVVMGGLRAGMTTDGVAAMLADRVKADLLIKATDQDGVFSRDPRRFSDATKLDSLSFDDLLKMFELDRHEAGMHQILDPKAVRILHKRRIKTIIVNGFRPENVLSAVNGERIGTIIE